MMKRKLITLTAVGALALGGFAIAQTPTTQTPIAQTPKTPSAQPAGRGSGHERAGRGGKDPFSRLTERLNLTADQKAKAQPIFDQARPELTAMHQDTMQKTKAIMDKVSTQLRPLLTAEQQKTLDSQQQRGQGKGQGGKKGQKGMQDGTNE
jgi:Spy/CpxP family protein refolding chaperone